MGNAHKVAFEYAKENGILGQDYNQIYDAVVFGYEQAEKERNIVERKSPKTGGKLQLLTEESEVTFRGEKVKYPHKHYHCIDSGDDFTDTELDNDNMWAIFRAYCEKRGFEHFSDIVFRKDLELTPEDIGCILEIWLLLNRDENVRNAKREDVYRMVLTEYNNCRK